MVSNGMPTPLLEGHAVRTPPVNDLSIILTHLSLRPCSLSVTDSRLQAALTEASKHASSERKMHNELATLVGTPPERRSVALNTEFYLFHV